MSKIFQIKINPNYSEIQDYERNNSNLMRLHIQLPDVKLVELQNKYVGYIIISVDGMLGLGMELIRAAMEIETDGNSISFELMPTSPGSVCQDLGIILTHNSCRLIIWDENLGSYLEEVKLSQKKMSLKDITQSWGARPSFKHDSFLKQVHATNEVFDIDLNPSTEEEQIYEKNNCNFMYLSVKLPNGKIISNYASVIILNLSIDGMLGLGTELIRKAIRIKAGQTTPAQETEKLKPIGPSGGSSGRLGVYLTHDSCNLELAVKDLGTVDKQLELCEKD
jgi:hypothetical protein